MSQYPELGFKANIYHQSLQETIIYLHNSWWLLSLSVSCSCPPPRWSRSWWRIAGWARDGDTIISGYCVGSSLYLDICLLAKQSILPQPRVPISVLGTTAAVWLGLGWFLIGFYPPIWLLCSLLSMHEATETSPGQTDHFGPRHCWWRDQVATCLNSWIWYSAGIIIWRTQGRVKHVTK